MILLKKQPWPCSYRYKRLPTGYCRLRPGLKNRPQIRRSLYATWPIFSALGDYLRAIADYGQAVKINPDYVNAYLNRGISYYLLRNYQLAIADYNQAIKLDPQYSLAYINRGRAYQDFGDNQRTIKDFSKALDFSKNPKDRMDAEDSLRELGGEP